MLAALVAMATVAEWTGPLIAGGIGALLVRLAIGQTPSPLAGALEAGALASATWLFFGA